MKVLRTTWGAIGAAYVLALLCLPHPLAPGGDQHPLAPVVAQPPSASVAKNTSQPTPAPAPEIAVIPEPVPPDTSKPQDSPHPQIEYRALVSPVGPLYTTSPIEPFLSRLGIVSAWGQVSGSNPSPTIAIIDTGFALNHQQFTGRWGTHNWDFVHNDGSPMAGTSNPNGASVYHGTMTAGLAAFMNPLAKLQALQALDDSGVGYTDQVAMAVRYATDSGANIISLSLGSDQDDPYMREQIQYAIVHGVLVVAAAGNSGGALSYPAAYPEVMAIGASTASDTKASFSSYGPGLDVLAPGVAGDVCSATYLPSNATSAYSCGASGTSFATPIVAGLAALLLEHNSSLGPYDLMRAIELNADKPAGMGGLSRTDVYGYGRINVARAVLAISLGAPGGQLLNKATLSLGASGLGSGGNMNSTCVGIPTGTCQLILHGPSNQTIDLGIKNLDEFGGADYAWSATSLGLAPGTWTITATTTMFGQVTTSPAQSFTVSP